MLLSNVFENKSDLTKVAKRSNGVYVSLAHNTIERAIQESSLTQEDIDAQDWVESEL